MGGAASYMVGITPSTRSFSLANWRTSSIVSSSCPTPRWLSASHCSGTMTASAAVRPLMVSTPSDGGQSISTAS